MGTTAPDGAGAPQGPAVPIEGGHTDQGREALATQGPQRRQVEQQGTGTHRPNTWHTAEEGLALAPDWAGTERGIQGVLEGRHACVKPRNMGLDIGRWRGFSHVTH